MQDPISDVSPGAARPGLFHKEWTPERVSALSSYVLLVLLFGILLGLFAVLAQLYYIAAVIAGTLLAVLVAWQYEAAITVYVLIAFVPWGQTPGLAVGGSGVGKGIYVSEAMLGFLLVVWLGKYITGALPKPRFGTGFYIPIALYLFYCLVNVIHSFLFWDPHVNIIYQKPQVNVVEMGLRLLSVGALLLMATTISSSTWLARIRYALIAVGVYNTVNAALGCPVPFQGTWWPLVALLGTGYCYVLALDGDLPLPQRVLCGVIVAASLSVILIKNLAWVSGWLGLLVSLATITYLKNRKLFAITAACLCVAVAVAWPFLHTNVVERSESEGDFDRFSLMAGAWRYATTFPLGVGLGNYRTYNSYYYGEKWGTTTYTSAHGTYAQALSETGIPGLLLLGCVLACGFRWLLRSYHNLKPGPEKTFLLAAIGQMAAIAAAASLGDYLIPTYHNSGLVTFSATVYSWLIWGLAIAHIRLAGDQSDGSDDINCKLEYS